MMDYNRCFCGIPSYIRPAFFGLTGGEIRREYVEIIKSERAGNQNATDKNECAGGYQKAGKHNRDEIRAGYEEIT